MRADRAKLGSFPRATHWTGHLLAGAKPPGRVVIANLGSGVCDLLIADAIAGTAEEGDLGHLLDT